MVRKGVIGIPQDGRMTACSYTVKHYEEGSVFGIDGGRISECNDWEFDGIDDRTQMESAFRRRYGGDCVYPHESDSSDCHNALLQKL